jgi:hypothetical protein
MGDLPGVVQGAKNTCWCGHEFFSHTATQCNLCNISGANPHLHVFASNMDISRQPAAGDIRSSGFPAAGGSNTEIYQRNVTQLNAASIVGATTFTTLANGTNTFKVGDTIEFFEPANKQRTEKLTIQSITSPIVFVTTTPALNAHAITVTQLTITGSEGSTQGAACTANGQRAG